MVIQNDKNNFKLTKLSKEEKQISDKIARDKAKDFRIKYSFTSINSLEILKEFYILKFPNELGISGAHITKKGRDRDYNCIYINTNEPIGRQNFSLIHELYHVFYEKSNEIVSLYKMALYDQVECRAEKFASYVLIPRNELCKELIVIKNKRSSFNIEFNELFKLQEKFQVSFISLIVAINELENSNLIPKNINVYWKYKYKEYWSELEDKNDRYNNLHKKNVNFNKPENSWLWPKNFKENIENNINEGFINKDEVRDIIEFFEEG